MDPGGGHTHLSKPFPWGGYCCKNGYEGTRRYPTKKDLVVIKTHYPAHGKSHCDLAKSIKTIRLIRHPVDSFYSYYQYEKKAAKGNVPIIFLQRYIRSWRQFQEYWNKQENVMTFFYEDLLENPIEIFKEMMEAIGFLHTQEDIERAVNRYPSKGKMCKHLDKFRKKDLLLIQKELSDLLEMYGYEIPL